jgi:hypothetical protein
MTDKLPRGSVILGKSISLQFWMLMGRFYDGDLLFVICVLFVAYL